MSNNDDKQLVGVTPEQLRSYIREELVDNILKMFGNEEKAMAICMTLGAIIGTVVGRAAPTKSDMLGLMSAVNFMINSCAMGVIEIPQPPENEPTTQH